MATTTMLHKHSSFRGSDRWHLLEGNDWQETTVEQRWKDDSFFIAPKVVESQQHSSAHKRRRHQRNKLKSATVHTEQAAVDVKEEESDPIQFLNKTFEKLSSPKPFEQSSMHSSFTEFEFRSRGRNRDRQSRRGAGFDVKRGASTNVAPRKVFKLPEFVPPVAPLISDDSSLAPPSVVAPPVLEIVLKKPKSKDQTATANHITSPTTTKKKRSTSRPKNLFVPQLRIPEKRESMKVLHIEFKNVRT
mmetsp:Transcript_38037/g.53595  ORF Transcript_38037/g.53595 Transcript_38037/m.53595 type:complete len:246 (-) Transcript_38037:43-780(-)